MTERSRTLKSTLHAARTSGSLHSAFSFSFFLCQLFINDHQSLIIIIFIKNQTETKTTTNFNKQILITMNALARITLSTQAINMVPRTLATTSAGSSRMLSLVADMSKKVRRKYLPYVSYLQNTITWFV